MLNKSIFNLVESPNDLPSSNENMSELFYREVLPTTGVTDTATSSSFQQKFGGSNISLRWTLDNRTWLLPSRSYLKFDIEITKPGDGSEPITIADNIAPNMGICSTLINRMQFKMNDTTISNISQYVPQCESIANRIYNSSEWLNNNVGAAVNNWQASQKLRANDIAVDGSTSDYYLKSNDKVLDLNFDERYLVFNRNTLGLGEAIVGNGQPTTAIDISVDQVLTFTALQNFNFDIYGKIMPGDILIITFANQIYRRIFYVERIINSASLRVAISGPALAGALGANNTGDYKLILLRHRENINVLQYKSDLGLPVADQTSVAATGTITFATSPHMIKMGDIILHTNTAGQNQRRTAFWNLTDIEQANAGGITDVIKTNGTLDLVPILAAGNRSVGGILYSEHYVFTKGNELGYIQNNQAAGHAVEIQALGVNSIGDLLTITQLGATNLPDVDATWAIGDIALIHLANADENIAATIVNIDSSGNIYVGASVPIAADLGANDDGENYIIGRLRYQPSRESLSGASINLAKNKSKFNVCWKPSCLSIFNYPGAIPGGCKFELELQALAQKYPSLAIETPFGIQKSARLSQLVGGSDYQLLVKNMKLYICQVQGPVIGGNEYQYYINLNEIRAHNQKITSASLTQTTLDVMPSSYALALAFQDSRAEAADRTDISISKFKVNNGDELALTRYSMRFAGISVPQPDAEMKVSDDEEYLMNQYMRNQLYTNQYFKQAGGESYSDWKERGIFFYHPFIRSATNRESRAYIITQFNQNENLGVQLSEVGLENLRAYIFEFYRAFAVVKMKNGFVYEVRTANQ